ncbi:Hypothetical predicted protein [Xyrichtys novacula]|uniref:Uncharacterized protein n=1 Tax=Xyrichtys novacula TaxID=13765 RepID=A0AAV1G2D6_XYRNO|nr:Hypothetical predicted protein [Xyrichtys novacula]
MISAERVNEERRETQDEVMALMHVLALCVTLGLRKGRRPLQKKAQSVPDALENCDHELQHRGKNDQITQAIEYNNQSNLEIMQNFSLHHLSSYFVQTLKLCENQRANAQPPT